MIKTARTPLKDPVAERLVQQKTNWNKEVSQFINDLIHFKKTMNGWPSKFYKERSKLNQPIPADPATIIGVLAGDFQEIAQRGNAIVQQQLSFVKDKQQKKQQRAQQVPAPQAPQGPATPPAGGAPPTAVDLTKQLGAAFEIKYGLVAEGSNPMTRFFTRLLNPGIGSGPEARVRKYRTSLLDAAAKTYRELANVQAEVVGSSPESIFASSKMLNKAEHNWSFLFQGFNVYEATMGVAPVNGGGPIEAPADIKKEREEAAQQPNPEALPTDAGVTEASPDVSQWPDEQVVQLARKYIDDFDKNVGPGKLPVISDPSLAQFAQTAQQFVPAMPPYQADLARYLIDMYNSVVQAYCMQYGVQAHSLYEVLSRVNSNAKQQAKQEAQQQRRDEKAEEKARRDEEKRLKEEQKKKEREEAEFKRRQLQMGSWSATPPQEMEKVAQKFVQRWVGKTYHQLNPFDRTSAFRLDIYNLSNDCRKALDKIMNQLEKGLDVEAIKPYIKEIGTKMYAMRQLMRTLESTTRGRGFQEPFLNLLEKGKITDIMPNLTEEQKKSLEKSLKHRQMRDLTQFYGKK